MNKWIIISVAFLCFTYGSIQETLRIMGSQDPEILSNRVPLMIIGFTSTALFGFFSIKFWIKGLKDKN